MKILVTGGAGFIGSHLVKALDAQGHDVFVLDNLSSGVKENIPSHIPFIEADIQMMDSLTTLPESIDYIFHLAAQVDVRKSVKDPEFNNAVNIEGTKKVIDYGIKAGMSKMVFSSTGGAIYGPAETLPTPEGSPCNSSSPYGESKYQAEELLLAAAKEYGFSSVILRYANVYGPGQNGSKETGVIAIFTQNAHDNNPSDIYGDGEQTRDFVYVDDVVAANVLVAEKEIEGIYNVGTGEETSITKLAEILKELVSPDLEFIMEAGREGEESRSCLDASKIKAIGWTPLVTLKEGLQRTLDSLK
jgi:UDP-glucose 4-epimerase